MKIYTQRPTGKIVAMHESNKIQMYWEDTISNKKTNSLDEMIEALSRFVGDGIQTLSEYVEKIDWVKESLISAGHLDEDSKWTCIISIEDGEEIETRVFCK